MASSAVQLAAHPTLIGDRFAVDLTRPLAGTAGTLASFRAIDRQGGPGEWMAVQVAPHRPPRAAAIAALAHTRADTVLLPAAHGALPPSAGRAGYVVITPVPSGPALSAQMKRPLDEAELIDQILRPAVQALAMLEAAGVTHRAIRLDNLFRAGPGAPVVLGEAWSAPPASRQPGVYEPPYSAMCLSCGRGEGSAADDVYALGVVLVALALGRVPLAGLDDSAVLRRKLDLGSYVALVSEDRLPSGVAELVRGMLAEDPDHRPTLALLADPTAARTRRLAVRAPRRAQRALAVGGTEIRDTRTLAAALAAATPGRAVDVLRGEALGPWLRRSLGNPALAAKLDELMTIRRHDDDSSPGAVERADHSLVAGAVSLFDPLAPLCWRGVAIWPDGIGPAIAAAQGEDPLRAASLLDIVASDAVTRFAAGRTARCDEAALRSDARKHQALLITRRGPAGGREGNASSAAQALCYGLNPLLSCASPILDGHCVARLGDLLPAMESIASAPETSRADAPLLDMHLIAFIGARLGSQAERELSGLGQPAGEAELAQIRLFALLQGRYYPHPLPALAGWLVRQASPLVDTWQNRSRRIEFKQRLDEVAATGRLDALMALAEDRSGRTQDIRRAQDAARALARIDAELAQIVRGVSARAESARCMGQEVAAGTGLAALVGALLMVALL